LEDNASKLGMKNGHEGRGDKCPVILTRNLFVGTSF
jgi:hypothetical protein